MNHQAHRTAAKLRQRIDLIAPRVYVQQAPIDPFQFRALDGPETEPPIDEPIDDRYLAIPWDAPWGAPRLDFVLRSHFTVPRGWGAAGPVALHLPLGVADD